MSRRLVFAASVVLILIGSALARARPYPRFTVILPEGVPSQKVVVNYVLYGSFGSFGGYMPQKPDSRTVEIRTAVKGKAASEIRMFVWAPGCKIATFQTSLHESSDIHEAFLCAFLPTLNLEGQVRSPQLLRKRNAEVSVVYIAKWSCEFFGFTDCMVPQLQLGIAKPDASGVFTIEIPDFSADPIAVSGIYGGELELILRDAKTWNHIAILAPESETLRTCGLALKIESSYPRNLALVEPKPN